MSIYSNDRPHDRCLPTRFYGELLEHVQQCGLSTDNLLEGTGLNEQQLNDEAFLATQAETEQLIINALKITGEPNLGMIVGAKFNISSHGVVGFAALSSATVADALDVANKYIPIITPLIEISTPYSGRTIDGNECGIIDIKTTALMSADVKRFTVDAILSSLHVMANFMLSNELPAYRVELDYPLQSYHDVYSARVGSSFVGDCEHNRILLPVEVLKRPIPLADKNTYRRSIEQCDELLQQLPSSQYSLSQAIRKRLSNTTDCHLLSQEEIAEELNMSPRTLHRLLSKENTKFRELATSVRIHRAKKMLQQTQYSISQIAHELGYTDAANFTRAFRKLEGVSPSEFRGES